MISWTYKLLLPALFSGMLWNTPVRSLFGGGGWYIDWPREAGCGFRHIWLLLLTSKLGGVCPAGWVSAITTPLIRGCGKGENPVKMMRRENEYFEVHDPKRMQEDVVSDWRLSDEDEAMKLTGREFEDLWELEMGCNGFWRKERMAEYNNTLALRLRMVFDDVFVEREKSDE